MISLRTVLTGYLALAAVSFSNHAIALNSTTEPTTTPALFDAIIEIGKPLQPIPIPGGSRQGKQLLQLTLFQQFCQRSSRSTSSVRL